MSLRATKRNARRATNYGLQEPAGDWVVVAAPSGTVFRGQEPSALARQQLERLLSNGERLAQEAAANAGAAADGDQATGDDRVESGGLEEKPYNPFAI